MSVGVYDQLEFAAWTIFDDKGDDDDDDDEDGVPVAVRSKLLMLVVQ